MRCDSTNLFISNFKEEREGATFRKGGELGDFITSAANSSIDVSMTSIRVAVPAGKQENDQNSIEKDTYAGPDLKYHRRHRGT